MKADKRKESIPAALPGRHCWEHRLERKALQRPESRVAHARRHRLGRKDAGEAFLLLRRWPDAGSRSYPEIPKGVESSLGTALRPVHGRIFLPRPGHRRQRRAAKFGLQPIGKAWTQIESHSIFCADAIERCPEFWAEKIGSGRDWWVARSSCRRALADGNRR